MRVLFAVFPATAHLHPITPLAWALQSAGHEVRVVSHPEMAGPISAVGLTPVSLGETVDLKAPAPDIRPRLERVTRALALTSDSHPWRVFSEQVLPALGKYFPAGPPATGHRDMLDDLVEFTGAWQPDLVLWDPAFLPAPIAARLSGAAHARMMWGPDYFAWSRKKFLERPQPPGAEPVEDPQLAVLGPMLDRYGMEFDEELLLGQWTVDPLPTALQLPLDTRSVPVRWVPYNGSSAVPDWLHEQPKRPRVGLSLGITERERAKDGQFSISELVGTVAELDIELVATLNADQLASLDNIPDNVRTVDYLPLNQLLPSCSAIIHHGGTAPTRPRSRTGCRSSSPGRATANRPAPRATSPSAAPAWLWTVSDSRRPNSNASWPAFWRSPRSRTVRPDCMPTPWQHPLRWRSSRSLSG